MVTLTDDAVSGARDGHLRRLKRGVIRRGERVVGRETGDPRVVSVAINDCSGVVKRIPARTKLTSSRCKLEGDTPICRARSERYDSRDGFP
jgi:hypothetical protein